MVSLLLLAAGVMAYCLIMSVVTPIQFEQTHELRQKAIVTNLIQLRQAELEYNKVHGRFTADLDSLVLFLKTTPMKEVLKEGSLTDKQLEAGLTEAKAVKILETAKAKASKRETFASTEDLYKYIWENDKEVIANSLSGFRRDTIEKNMIETLYKGAVTLANVDDLKFIPYSNGEKFELEVNNEYTTSQGIRVPLFEARAPFQKFLGDLNQQELVNLIDKEEKLGHYAGLMVGSIDAPNNNAGNWE